MSEHGKFLYEPIFLPPSTGSVAKFAILMSRLGNMLQTYHSQPEHIRCFPSKAANSPNPSFFTLFISIFDIQCRFVI